MLEGPKLLKVRRGFNRVPAAVLAELATAQTSQMVDAMNGRGALSPKIKPLVTSMRFAGSAVTAGCAPGDNLAGLAALDYLKPGDVLVIATQGFADGAVTGDIVVTIAKKRGAAAIVTDGAVRDIAGILDLGLPVFSATITPNTAYTQGPGEIGLPVSIGGRVVESGDLVVGDRDGVVVVPAASIDATVAAYRKVIEAEAALIAELNGGGELSIAKRIHPEIDARTEFVD